MLPSGRMSVCGLNEDNIDYVVHAVGEVAKTGCVQFSRGRLVHDGRMQKNQCIVDGYINGIPTMSGATFTY